MASNSSNLASSKSVNINAPKQAPSTQFQLGLGVSDLATQRRSPLGGGSGGSGSAGAGRYSRTTSTPRNSQSSRKKNKQTNKYRHDGGERLNDLVDHALSETVSDIANWTRSRVSD